VIHDYTFFRFIIAGIINTAIGAGIMFLLYNIGELSYWAASAASYIAGSVCSFFLNKYFTFSVKEWDIRMVILFVSAGNGARHQISG
jgi:putative flippase GtrA